MKFMMNCAIALALLPAVSLCGSQKRLVADRVAELRALNRLVLQTIKDPARLNGKKIYVKIRVLPDSGDGQLKFKVEKISVTEIKQAIKRDEKTLYLKGEVKKGDKNSYIVDLSDILPPPDRRRSSGKVKRRASNKEK